MPHFLLELRSEEIPARMQPAARAELQRLFRAQTEAAGLAVHAVRTLSTPRRLALIADVAPATKAVSEERKGPRADARPQAVDGFLRSTGLTRDQLEEREVKGALVLFAVTEKPARPASAVLADAIPAVVRDFSWPKSMRWGEASLSTESPRWVRPLHGIVALLDGEVVPCEAAGIVAARETLGHRVHAPGPLSIDGAESYEAQLRAAHVLADPDERRRIIAEGAEALAAGSGLALVADEGLLTENVGLTEWPMPLLGRFDEASLTLPPEVIQLTARVNQKYFVTTLPPQAPLGEGDRQPQAGGGGVVDHAPPPPPAAAVPTPEQARGGMLAPAFVCVANLEATDGGTAIVAGNVKVLAARLSDARFFWKADLAVPLDEQAAKLDRIVFHKKLGTVADKVDRVAKLARWLVEEGVVRLSTPLPAREGLGVGASGASLGAMDGGSASPSPPTPDPSLAGRGEDVARLAALAERAARLCKADLVTATVTEFPELQGIAGGHLALAQGEDPQVAAAIRDHYKPVGTDDEVPTAPVTVAVSLSDKLDTLAAFFAVGEIPTGSRDPLALRRAALGVVSVIVENKLRLQISAGSAFTAGRVSANYLLANTAAAIQVATKQLKLLADVGVDVPLARKALKLAIGPTLSSHNDEVVEHAMAALKVLKVFYADRLKVQQREAGVRHDLIDAVFALGGEDDLVRLIDRTKALQQFVETPEGADLLAGYKRAVNILKKEGVEASSPPPVTPADAGAQSTAEAPLDPRVRGDDGEGEGSSLPGGRASSETDPALGRHAAPQGVEQTGEEDPLAVVGDDSFDNAVADAAPDEPASTAEEVLIAALATADVRVQQAVEKEEWENAMSALASLRDPIDRFFEHATVNDPDPATRERRLALLVRVRNIMHRVADFSQIES